MLTVIAQALTGLGLLWVSILLMPKGPSDMGVSPPCGPRPKSPPPNQGSGGRKPSGVSGVRTVKHYTARGGVRVLDFEIELDGEPIPLVYGSARPARQDVIQAVMQRTQPFPQRACNCPGCGAPKLGTCAYCGRP